ncbi:MAG: DUF2862 domain-containing protein [Spirulina sp. SIO3F2]|nr:DUF2862 domain-containing protein [Spirulina sp. SIO3F2]
MNIGQKVQVYRIKDRVGRDTADKLGKVGTITGFKMTDGSGIGAVVEFDDNSAVWFFAEELRTV